jgi:hypothetical protein
MNLEIHFGILLLQLAAESTLSVLPTHRKGPLQSLLQQTPMVLACSPKHQRHTKDNLAQGEEFYCKKFACLIRALKACSG